MADEKAIEECTAEELTAAAAKTGSTDEHERDRAYDALVEIDERAATAAGAHQLALEKARARRPRR